MGNALDNVKKLRAQYYVTEPVFGAKGDDATDCLAPFTSAFTAAAGKAIYVPAGTFRIPFTGSTALTVPAGGLTIEGDGKDKSIIKFVPSSTSHRQCIAVANALKLRGVKVEVALPTGGSASLFAPSGGTGVKAEDCDLDGNSTDSGGVIQQNAYMVEFQTGATTAGNEFLGCDIHHFKYPVLKSNASTSTDRRITYAHCDFYNNYYEDLGFNSPNGVMDDVQVYACRFRDGKGTNVNHDQLYIAFASVTNFRVALCTFTGTLNVSGDAIHIEENCRNGTVTGNTIEVDGNAIMVSGNNVGGSITMPQHITISANTIRKAGTVREAGSYGIALVQNVSLHLAAKALRVTGNVVYGYEFGFFSTTTLDDGCEFSGNTADACTYGYDMRDSGMAVSGNTSKDCTVGVRAGAGSQTPQADGSVYRSHHFINCTTNADATERPIVLLDPCFSFPEFNHAGGATNVFKDLLPAGASDRIHGFLEIACFHDDAANYSTIRDEVTWDGAVFTRTNKITIQPGDINTQAARNVSALAVQVFGNADGSTNLRLSARLNGMAVVAV